MKARNHSRLATPLVLCLCLTSSLNAQISTTLTAQDIVEKAIRALGGRAQMLKIDRSLIQGTLDVKSVDIQGTYKIYSARPNKLYARFDVDTMGVLERGVGYHSGGRLPASPDILPFLSGIARTIPGQLQDQPHYGK